ncbi:MAG TPA: nuclear transport factor 2 family protein [Anaeromyxobacter sp.]
MTRARNGAPIAAALALLGACSGHVARSAPAKGDGRNFASQVLELRDAALNAHDLDGAARAYAVDAEVIDADTATVVLRGRDEIRAAHARFLAACPRGRIEVLDRAYGERGRIVADAQRVFCDRPPPVDGWVRYEIAGGSIVRVLKHASPPFGG